MSHLKCICVFIFLIGFTATAQNSHTPATNHPEAPYSEQDVLLLFSGRSGSDRILLTLNNNRPSTLVAQLTLYDLNGNPIDLPVQQLNPSESRLIEFGAYLRSLSITSPLGFLRVHYSGRSMEVGAQLTLYPIEGRGGLDSPRSLSVDFVGTERHAVAWIPVGGTSHYSITNVSPNPVVASVLVNGIPESITIAPNQTVLREKERFSDLLEPLTSLDVTYSGPNDALRVFGYVASPSVGALPIRTYDPKGATTSILSAVGLVTRNPTRVAIRNLSSAPIWVVPRMSEVTDSNARVRDTGTITFSAPKALIPPHASMLLPVDMALRQMEAAQVDRATLFLDNQAEPGSLVGSVDQIVAPDLVQDIPLKTSNPVLYMRGMYPLRWTKDYTNSPMVTNTSGKPAPVRAYVISGGVTYTFPIITITAGSTAKFDVDQVRAKQTPDSRGNRIPATAEYGKFHWAPVVGTEKTRGFTEERN